PLTALESGQALTSFDLVGFTLQHELSYTNILKMLDLSGIPRRSSQRSETDPLVMAGGPSAFNVEPLADFFDFVVLGEGEEVIHEILDLVIHGRAQGLGKDELLEKLVLVDGIYVPHFYQPTYSEDGTFRAIEPRCLGIPTQIEKRVIRDFDNLPYPEEFVVPYVEVIHDRVIAEIMRGCTRGCRFCQAGMIYRPLRERSPQILLEQIARLVESTGYEEISLSSLSSGDYGQIGPLVRDLMAQYQSCGVSISLPSLRLDSFGIELAQEIQKVRKTGLTFAPEAGTQRLRDVINKNVSDQDLKEVVEGAFAAGWSRIKLYFMIGLPTETEEDLEGIVDLAHKVLAWGKESRSAKRRPEVTISVASFVPKPHTPFQWMAQDSMEALRHKQRFLKERLTHRGIHFSYPRVEESFLEAVLARGDRRLADVIEKATDLGCHFDSWTDCLRFDLWEQAFSDVGIDPHGYAERQRDIFEPLPWKHLSAGIDAEFLRREWELAKRGTSTPDCRWDDCSGCGVCPGLGVANALVKEKDVE
ncbi:MAG: TIGR03960 family B12-binding radical SAM protein, partial [Limnochordia bacterium]|nr:TIGR03960 family B12-binding radical SAM protein [Limnochordia bacterium]